MNTSLPDIYNNLNNYSVTKRPLLQPPSQGQRQKIFYYFILKI
jgi:hypothetical protein